MREKPLPGRRPCSSCPYRQDVPSGVWHPEEYEKLPRYDAATFDQPTGLFMCHQQDGRMCAGWAGCHDMGESLALRLAVASGRLSADQAEDLLDYASEVPLFPSGQAAAVHGMSEVEAPGERAGRVIGRLTRKRGRAESA